MTARCPAGSVAADYSLGRTCQQAPATGRSRRPEGPARRARTAERSTHGHQAHRPTHLPEVVALDRRHRGRSAGPDRPARRRRPGPGRHRPTGRRAAHPVRRDRHEPRPHQRHVRCPHPRRRRAGQLLRQGAGPRRGVRQALSQGGARQERAGDPRRQADRPGGQRRDRQRARPARHPRDEGRQGLPLGQAGDDDAGAARRGAEGPGPDQADLLGDVQRAPREPRHREGRRSRPGRRHRQGDPDGRPRAAPRDPGRAGTARLVLRQGAVRRHPDRHRLAPVRPVPVLHRIDRGEDRGLAGRQPAPPAPSPASRTSATA